jgi:hypothetical protein
MARRKLPYTEGDWIAVPLRSGGYAPGLIARSNGRGGMLGYFFGPRHQSLPVTAELQGLEPKHAVLVCRLGDLGLIRQTWTVLGPSPNWEPGIWPVPRFVRREEGSGRTFIVEYDQDDAIELVREALARPEDGRGLPKDGLYGSGAVEILLDHLLAKAS